MLWNLFVDFVNFIIKSLGFLFSTVLSILPDSPFEYISNSPVSSYITGFTWIIPIEPIVAILTSWLVAISIYYIVMILLRWVKAIN